MEKIALTPRSKELIKNYLIGGAAIGGSGALLSSLINYINTLKSQAPKDEERENDDTLYLNVGQKAAAESAGLKDLAAGGVAITGGLLSTLGTYALVRKMYQKMKKKQLQEELDKAQQSFIGTSEEEAKMAAAVGGKPMGLAELGWSSPVAFALISALAAGALTNKSLDKTFPQVKKPQPLGPKKVVLRRSPAKKKTEESDDNEKNAYDKIALAQQYDDGLEFLIHLCMGSKSASESELADIVHAAAQGRGPELTTTMLELGFDTAMHTIKGASEKHITPLSKQLAISYCVKSAALSPVVSLLAAAEYNDMAPRLSSIANVQSDECKDTLLKIAGAIGALNRAEMTSSLIQTIDEAEAVKAANDMSLEDLIAAITEMHAQGGMPAGLDEESEANDEDLVGEDSLESGDEKGINDSKPMSTSASNTQVIDNLDEDDDFIDSALSSPITPAKAVAAEMA